MPLRPAPTTTWLAGMAAVLGGLVWLVHTILLAVRPVGCVGRACFEGARHHRESEDIAWVLLLSVLLLAVSVGTAMRVRGAGRRLMAAAFVLLCVGAVLLALGLIVNRGSSEGSPLWWLHDSDTLGRLLPVLGTLVAGIALLRGGTPRWLCALFVIAATAGFAVNIQDDRALLSLPIGLAWMVFGTYSLASARRATGSAHRLPDSAGHAHRP